MNRRNFIQTTTLASGALFLPSFLKAFERRTLPGGNKVLVVIQLGGGNDGLNTLIPYQNDIYYNKRKTLAIPKQEIITLNDQLGLNPGLQSFKEVFDQGWMSIVNSVGYPNPDRSHFRSMDIWQSASAVNEYVNTGWIGRYLDSSCKGCENPYHAIEVDDTLSLAMKGNTKKAIAVRDVNKLYRSTREPFFEKLAGASNPDMLSDDNLGYLYKTMIETYSSAAYISETGKIFTSKAEYPDTGFAKQLKMISGLIQSGLDTKIYYVSLGGFDTHVGQKGTQERLLKTWAEGVSTFLKDLNSGGKLDDTLVMTFSEFGRRVEQNASNGTDHG
ncbi:MAG TPA: DUF1501 domain-containing protein, partial [Bacteroidia bacterium]|nr:DUF1501 domain-containing protein [Bacteroidia bacterium]